MQGRHARVPMPSLWVPKLESRLSAYCHLCNGIAFTGIVWQAFFVWFSHNYNEWLMLSVFIRETITVVDIVSSFKLSKKISKLLLKMLLFRQFLVEFIFWWMLGWMLWTITGSFLIMLTWLFCAIFLMLFFVKDRKSSRTWTYSMPACISIWRLEWNEPENSVFLEAAQAFPCSVWCLLVRHLRCWW